jgi:hypothetical protein
MPPLAGPVHRVIVAFDIEGSTKRNNLAKGEIRRVLYELVERALTAAGITSEHLDKDSDRGDGVLILIRPHDEVPKTVVLVRLMPILATLLLRHNAAVTQPELGIRLRAVVHAGEIHEDKKGFYGDALDTAFRLLESRTVKKALETTPNTPIILVVSEEIYTGIVRQGYVDSSQYGRSVRVLVGDEHRRGRLSVPIPMDPSRLGAIPQLRAEHSPSLTIAPVNGHGRAAINRREGPRSERGSPGAGRR